MAWLEAQAAGLPVVAEDGPAARAVIGGATLTPPDDPRAFAEAITAAAADRPALARAARAHVEAHHSLDAAAATLKSSLAELLP
jgi:glycosyltransferase involved in cell wall biosynthesis